MMPVTDTGPNVTRLANGLTVATDPMPGLETISLGVYIRTGTRDEPASLNGVAHFLEHMAFKGTQRRNAKQIAEEIESVGGQINAYTAREVTCYYTRLLADHLELGIDILSDILQHSIFDQTEIDRERAVILQEIGQADDTPDDIIWDYFQETAFPDQAMGRPVLGRVPMIKSMSRDDLISYMDRHYTPQRMVVAAAGKVDHNRMVKMVERSFSHLGHRATLVPEGAVYRGGDFRSERDLEQLHIVMGFQGVSFRDPDYWNATILSSLLGGGMSSRLFQEVREKRGLAYSIYCFSSSYSDDGLFGVYAGTDGKDAPDLMAVIGQELKSVTDNIGGDELNRAKSQLKAQILMARERPGARCEALGHQWLTHGRIIPPSEAIAHIEAATESDLRRALSRIIARPISLAAIGPVANVPRQVTLSELMAAESECCG